MANSKGESAFYHHDLSEEQITQIDKIVNDTLIRLDGKSDKEIYCFVSSLEDKIRLGTSFSLDRING